jgi:hypothetical protein
MEKGGLKVTMHKIINKNANWLLQLSPSSEPNNFSATEKVPVLV